MTLSGRLMPARLQAAPASIPPAGRLARAGGALILWLEALVRALFGRGPQPALVPVPVRARRGPGRPRRAR